jgi:hypothetical protein
MIYSAPRFNNFFAYLDNLFPCSFIDNIHKTMMNEDSLTLETIDDIIALYDSNFEPITRLRVYSEGSIKKMIETIYYTLESYGLDYSYQGDEETFHLVKYSNGMEDFLLYRGYKERSDDSTFQLFAAFLYVMDAFIRGENSNEFAMRKALDAFNFPRHFPELDYLTESEAFSRGISTTYDSIKKAAYLPEYLLDDNSYILVDNVFYEKESVNKAIDGYSMTAQSLERQDLEGSMIDVNTLSEDERIISFIKMLKERRKRKKNEVKSESNVDR